MRLLRFIVRTAGIRVLGLSLLSLLSSAANAGLVAVVHHALSGSHDSGTVGLFVLAAAARVGSSYANGWMLSTYEHGSLRTLRANLAQRILDVPLQRFESLGKARLMTTLGEDVMRLQGAMHSLSSIVTAAATTAGGCAYMIYLSPRTFALVAVLGTLAAAINRRMARRAWPHFEHARDAEEALQGRLVDLVEGIKELKLNQKKRQALLRDGVNANSALASHHRLQARRAYLIAHVLGQAPAMIAILALVAGVQWGLTSATESAGFILATLYIAGPTSALINNSDALSTATIALTRIEAVVDGLDSSMASKDNTLNLSQLEFTGIQLRDIRFSYANDEKPFTLGPVSLDVMPGEVLFITGDNGSGKSTLALLIAGLYEPTSGTVQPYTLVDDAPYRAAEHEHVSAVLSDYHLFDRAWTLPQEAAQGAAPLLDELGLGELAPHLVEQNSGIHPDALSQGQRRRLALALCLLEDRPLLIFDEFAADQDPTRKEWFYRTLVPRLRAQGKALVVVTHDSRYFDAADRCVHLAGGRVVPAPCA